MKVKMGGITRNIDEKHLQVYKDKGYEVVEEVTVPVTPEPDAGGKKAATK
ncbi:hypothetical protein [Caproicibacterium sp. XB1]